MTFAILPSVEGPFELGRILLDDTVVFECSTPAGDWSEQGIDVAPGERRVTFQLLKNPGEIPEAIHGTFEPSADREGRIYLDGVNFTAA